MSRSGQQGGKIPGRAQATVLMTCGAFLALLGALVLLTGVRSEVAYRELSEEVRSRGDGDHPGDGASVGSIDWDLLWQTNGDVVGWVQVDGTTIDHPVVRGGDNEWYLRHDLWGGWSEAGCPFLDVRADPDDGPQLVFGHHLGASSEMFSELHDVWRQEAFDRLGICTWITPCETLRLRPAFAMSVDEGYAEIQRFSFATPERMREWARSMGEGASARAEGWEGEVLQASRVVSLVTCSSDIPHQRARTVVVFVA